MIIKFNDGSFARLHRGLNKLHLCNKYSALSDFSGTTKLFTDDYTRELATSTHVVFVNDFVVDGWLPKYNLALEKAIFRQLMSSHSASLLQTDMDNVMNSLSERFLLLDLPVRFQKDLEFNLNLVKYLKLQLDAATSAQARFEQLLRVHSRICADKVLVVNHVIDYDVDIDQEMVRDFHVTLLVLK